MKTSRKALAFLGASALGACAAPQVAVNPKADFGTIRRVAVAPFKGSGGEQAADTLLQDLLARGADVIERARLEAVLHEHQLTAEGILDPATVKKVGKILGVDAIFVGTVTTYQPGQSYLVTSPRAKSVVVREVTPVQGKYLYSEGSAPGVPDSQVIASAATVGLIARLVDVETGSVLWSARMNYEGLELEDALAEVTSAFADSLVPVWPALHKPK